MAIDPIIEAVFGPPPPSIDLSESRVIVNNVIAVVLLGIATIAVVLRLWARKLQEAGWGSDDWTIIASLVCCFIIHFGIPLQKADVILSDIQRWRRCHGRSNWRIRIWKTYMGYNSRRISHGSQSTLSTTTMMEVTNID
jgi:hypothetical protein